MQDREALKHTLTESLHVMLQAKRGEMARRGRQVSEAELIQWCRNLLNSVADAAKAQVRLYVDDEELALRRELLEEILAERHADS
jgi:hypothetical protein